MRNCYIVVTSVLLLTLNFNHPYFVLFLIPVLISETNLRLPKVIGPLLLLLSLPFLRYQHNDTIVRTRVLTGD